jgi:hypothetical protein
MADLEVRTKMRTLMLDTFKLGTKSLGASSQLLATQKQTYACDGYCRDIMNLVTPVLVDDYSRDNSGAGRAIGGVLATLGTAQNDTATSGSAAVTEAKACADEIARINSEVSAIAASFGPGPVAMALQQAVGQLNAAGTQEKKVDFKVDSLFARCSTLISKATSSAGAIAAEGPKDPRDVSGAGFALNGYIKEAKVAYAQSGTIAVQCGGAQNGVTVHVNQAAEFLNQAVQAFDQENH